mmetsp:Transcript_17358/g.22572  ORF Transcript_17358/g.22572 Transcript_17358/m.22572 type:complete len:229 (+) Transcript_17358:40-726(+)
MIPTPLSRVMTNGKREREEERAVIEEPKRKEHRRMEPKLAMKEKETDPRRLTQRRKDIQYGKNTLGYERYIRMVPKNERKRSDPMTPDIEMKASKRQFDGIVKAWRRRLHEWDPPTNTDLHLENPLLPKKDESVVSPSPRNVEANVSKISSSTDDHQQIQVHQEDDDEFGPTPLLVLPPATVSDNITTRIVQSFPINSSSITTVAVAAASPKSKQETTYEDDSDDDLL